MHEFLENAKEVLRKKPLSENKMIFMGVPIEEFEKEDLIKILCWSRREYDQLQKNADQNRRMHEMFSGLKG